MSRQSKSTFMAKLISGGEYGITSYDGFLAHKTKAGKEMPVEIVEFLRAG